MSAYKIEVLHSVRIPVGAQVNGKTAKTTYMLPVGVATVSDAPVHEWAANGYIQIVEVDGKPYTFSACCAHNQ